MLGEGRLEDLVLECQQLGLVPIATGPKGKVKKLDCEIALQNHYLGIMRDRGDYAPGLFLIHDLIQSPQLAEPETTFSPPAFKELLSRTDVYAEEKIDGARVLITYHPGSGLELFSRNRSVTDHLFGRYENQWFGLSRELTRDIHPRSFVIDGELFSMNPSVNGRVVTDSVLSAVVAMMGMERTESHRMQAEAGYPLRFKAFDLLWYDGVSFLGEPYSTRRAKLSLLLSDLWSYGEAHNLPLRSIEEHPFIIGGYEAKQALFDEVIARGGEGLVLKPSYGVYRAVEARGGASKATAIKWKRKVSMSTGGDIDAFVGDTFTPGEGKYEGLIGALDFYVYVTPGNRIHKIASISGFTDELRRDISYRSPTGELMVNPAYVNRVASIDGQDISARSLAFSHARLVRFRDGADGKRPVDCQFEEALLSSLVL